MLRRSFVAPQSSLRTVLKTGINAGADKRADLRCVRLQSL